MKIPSLGGSRGSNWTWRWGGEWGAGGCDDEQDEDEDEENKRSGGGENCDDNNVESMDAGARVMAAFAQRETSMLVVI